MEPREGEGRPARARARGCTWAGFAGLLLGHLLVGGLGIPAMTRAGQPPAPAALIALAGLALAGALVLGAPPRVFEARRPAGLRRSRLPVAGCAIALLGAGAVLRDLASAAELLFLAALGLGVAGALAARATDAIGPLLLLAPPLALSLLGWGVELHGRALGASWVTWGEGLRVAPLGQPPFVGAGGIWRPGLDVRLRSSEHPYTGARFVTERHGFRNVEDAAPAGSDQLLVLNVGDSFSAGFEVGQDEQVGAVIERALRARHGARVRVLNAAADDPALALYWLQTYGLAFRPRVVLLGLCTNDLLGTAHACGPGRTFELGPDGRISTHPQARPPDPLEALRGICYPGQATFDASYLHRPPPGRLAAWLGKTRLAALLGPVPRSMPSVMNSLFWDDSRRDGRLRLFDGFAQLGLYARSLPPPAEPLYARLLAVLDALQRAVEAAGARLVIAHYPQKFQVHPEEWAAMREFWGLHEEDFDLDLHDARLRAFCQAQGVAWVELVPPLRREAAERPGTLYFPLGDVHLNVRGTRAAGEAIAPVVAAALEDRG